jgi:predicted transposase/invertase (TIGR01784 family)
VGDDAPELRGASHDVERPLSDCYAERVSKLSTLDPSLDVVFKLLFTSRPESNELLIALLTAVLRPQKPFKNVVVRNPEIPREAIENHGTVLDIFAELEDGTRLDIEMQCDRRPSFRKRALYYWARMFGGDLARGSEYDGIRPAISVLFLGYRELRGDRVHSIFRLLEVHDHERFAEEMELHVIELGKLDRATSEERRDEAGLLAWTKFFAAKSDEEMKEASMKDAAVEKAHRVLEQVSADPVARRLAEQRLLAEVTWKMDLDAVREEGRAEGEARGAEAGRRAAQSAVLDLCEVLGVEPTVAQRESLTVMSLSDLDALRARIKRDRRWSPAASE